MRRNTERTQSKSNCKIVSVYKEEITKSKIIFFNYRVTINEYKF